jgi:hypothetical protein
VLNEPYCLLFIEKDLNRAYKVHENFALHNGRFNALFTLDRTRENAMGE